MVFVLGLSSRARAQNREPLPDAGSENDGASKAEVPPSSSSADAGAESGGSAPIVEPEGAAPIEAPPSSELKIEVTGSRIKQPSSFSPAAPVQVMDRKELEQTGAANMADVVSYLTVSQGSGSQGAGSLSVNSVSVNLRGLGEGATLILLNGRRMPLSAAYNPAGQQFTDLSTIPLAAVERIEILRGGASAIYGSDAVAGVINIITRKNFDGARIELDGMTTSRFDQRNGTASVALGATSKRGRVFVAGSYYNQSQLTTNQRDWTNGYYVSPVGYPGSFLVGTKVVPDPACNSVPGSMVTPVGGGSALCSFSYRNYQALIPEAERGNLFASGEYDITAHTTIFGELLGSHLSGSYMEPPAFPLVAPYVTVPANHVDNPFGQSVQAIIDPVGAEYGPVRDETDDDMIRGVVGIRGDFEDAAAGTLFETWQWEAYTTMSADRGTLIVPDTLRGVIQNDLNSCSNPANLRNCYNPFHSAVTGTGTPNSTALINSFYGALQGTTLAQMQTYNAGMTGSLFKLPGGDLALAFGGEVRHESRSTRYDHDSLQNAYSFLIGDVNAEASRNVYGGYLELGWPFFHGVMLQTAGRVEDYTDIDRAAFSPSAGLSVIPADIEGREKTAPALRRLQFRGNATSAFRAPNLYQSFPGYIVQPTPINVGQPITPYLPVQNFGNPQLKPEHALVVSGGFSWTPLDEFTVTADIWDYDYQDRIQLEGAQQLVNQFLATGSNPSVVVDPVSGQIARVTPKYINIPGDVITNGIDFGSYVILTSRTFGSNVPDSRAQKLSIGGVGTYVLTFNYPIAEGAPRMIPNTSPTVILPPAPCSGSGPSATCRAVGVRNLNNIWQAAMPRLKANFPVTWSYRGHALTFITHYISGYQDDAVPNPDGTFPNVSAWVTFDAQYAYTVKEVIGREFTVRVGVMNLADADPPKVNGTQYAYDFTLHDPRGRMLYANLTAQF
jgi:outer membrane receptor protein involved in Fe transport